MCSSLIDKVSEAIIDAIELVFFVISEREAVLIQRSQAALHRQALLLDLHESINFVVQLSVFTIHSIVLSHEFVNLFLQFLDLFVLVLLPILQFFDLLGDVEWVIGFFALLSKEVTQTILLTFVRRRL